MTLLAKINIACDEEFSGDGEGDFILLSVFSQIRGLFARADRKF